MYKRPQLKDENEERESRCDNTPFPGPGNPAPLILAETVEQLFEI